MSFRADEGPQVSFPDDTKHKNKRHFLNEKEVAWVMARVNADRADADLEPFSIKKWLAGAADVKVWGFAFLFGASYVVLHLHVVEFAADDSRSYSTTTSYALAYFLPIILVRHRKLPLC